MSTPMCPVHNSPMKQGRGGGYFCPRKDGDTWCTQKSSAAVASAPATVTPTPQAAPTTPTHLLLLGALDFAAKVYSGTGQGDDAMALANTVYAGWRNEL